MTKIAIVTPYFREDPEILERCLDSVAGQTLGADHFVVADGEPQGWLDRRSVRHIALDRNHDNYGNTPRAVAAMVAVGEGYDVIGFLDADNWVDPDHLEHCLAAARAVPGGEVDYILAKRRMRRPDGRELVLPDNGDIFHGDTNCLLFLRGAFHLLALWGTMPKKASLIGDRVIYRALKLGELVQAAAERPTVNYVTRYAGAYVMAGEEPPEGARYVDFDGVFTWLSSLDGRELKITERLMGVPLA